MQKSCDVCVMPVSHQAPALLIHSVSPWSRKADLLLLSGRPWPFRVSLVNWGLGRSYACTTTRSHTAVLKFTRWRNTTLQLQNRTEDKLLPYKWALNTNLFFIIFVQICKKVTVAMLCYSLSVKLWYVDQLNIMQKNKINKKQWNHKGKSTLVSSCQIYNTDINTLEKRAADTPDQIMCLCVSMFS